jgi:hypothetical protein
MRIKLSYTVEDEQVLKEAANLIGLTGEHLQQALTLFTSTQSALKGEGGDDPPNIEKIRDLIEEFRQALLVVDTRLAEVVDIIEGYEMYRISQRTGEGAPDSFAPETLPSTELSEG